MSAGEGALWDSVDVMCPEVLVCEGASVCNKSAMIPNVKATECWFNAESKEGRERKGI